MPHPPPQIRIGQGHDVHRIVPGRALFLGGVLIPWDRGLLGHSDADVLLHAVMDALLGALALGDIGQWFPDTDPAYRGIASSKLLQTILRSPQFQGWTVLNLDCTILAEKPKMAPHRTAIRESLASLLGITIGQVSLKAGTMEKLGFIGREEGMSAMAAVLLAQTEQSETP